MVSEIFYVCSIKLRIYSQNDNLKMTNNTNDTVKKHQNWFQTAYNNTPAGELISKRDQVCERCECSKKTFYRWKESGFVPSKRDLAIICEVFNLDVTTKKPIENIEA